MTMSGTGDRRGVRRTVAVLAVVALAIYIAFIASGVVGR